MTASPQLATARRRGEHGFSLVELMVVLTIIALATAAAPMIFAGLPEVRLRAAAADMAATLRGLHQQAIRRGETTELVLDLRARSYSMSGDPAPHPLPAVVATLGFESPSLWHPDGSPTVRFFPDGSATGGTIHFANGARSTTVMVDWLTGRVRRHD
ncbi:MAG TPA: GspH/FimT family protein [Stellaceae bacterium]|jgi:general secretion pathway protein H